MNAPVISSIGPPPDRHAERIVTEMLRYLHDKYRRPNAGDGTRGPALRAHARPCILRFKRG